MWIEIVGIPAIVGHDVSHLTLIGTVEGNRSLVDDCAELDWGCGESDRSCWLYGRIDAFNGAVGFDASCAMDQATGTSPRGGIL